MYVNLYQCTDIQTGVLPCDHMNLDEDIKGITENELTFFLIC